MGVRIWDSGEFMRLPEKSKAKIQHRLYCLVGDCPVMVEGKSAKKVLKAIRKHRKEVHGVGR